MEIMYLKDRIELHNGVGLVDGWYALSPEALGRKFYWWCNGTFIDIATIAELSTVGELMEEAFCVERE